YLTLLPIKINFNKKH
ncbi:hypothetical protein FOXB_03231, partial [Fusarium oxysporum f. sp. conglutinans Fo5176]